MKMSVTVAAAKARRHMSKGASRRMPKWVRKARRHERRQLNMGITPDVRTVTKYDVI